MQWLVAAALALVVRDGPAVLVQDQSLTFWPTVCIIQVNDPKQHYAAPGAVFARHPCRGAEIVVLATQESPMIENSPDGNVGNLARRLFVTTKGSIQGLKKSYWFQGEAGEYRLLEGHAHTGTRGRPKHRPVVCGANGPAVAVYVKRNIPKVQARWWCAPQIGWHRAAKGSAIAAVKLSVGAGHLLLAAGSTHATHGGGVLLDENREQDVRTGADKLKDVAWLVGGRGPLVPDVALWGADMNHRTILFQGDGATAWGSGDNDLEPMGDGGEFGTFQRCLENPDPSCRTPEWLARGPDRLGPRYSSLPALLRDHGQSPDGTPFLQEVSVRHLCPTKEKGSQDSDHRVWTCCPPGADCSDPSQHEVYRYKKAAYRDYSDRPSWCDRLVVGARQYGCDARATKLAHVADHDALFAVCAPPEGLAVPEPPPRLHLARADFAVGSKPSAAAALALLAALA